jgi:hypothetical protein
MSVPHRGRLTTLLDGEDYPFNGDVWRNVENI